MKKRIYCLSLLVLAVTVVSCGSKDGGQDSADRAKDQNEEKFESNKAEQDAAFAVEAANGGLLEVQLGTLAVTKASSPRVKQFGQMMVEDHTKANNELKALAQKKNMTLPTVMGDKHQRKYDNFAEKTGSDFDKAYMELIVEEHKEDINQFEKQAKEGNDPELKAWASAKLPTLQQHLREAEEIKKSLEENSTR
jgi:putative membrane protein